MGYVSQLELEIIHSALTARRRKTKIHTACVVGLFALLGLILWRVW